ncbi:TPA: hypothetical protein DD449_02435 [Candidatus Berkelbacteria bacterium]|uniref:Uncharacterized protein n=1 Tax=Berkelbacteria bacterium GW2011_GWE1_39_12 TaxID=1618337 RepID=A0A0G4B4L2_9BACT|nr:MAG: hypothetical protein UT28_C0001G0127 [Berkelbacteria bacterium GW2011_GWE1_39_12]HBO60514.1 hypothetical protein [Candidatus Berkelbacteria bacterium]
MTEVSKGEGAKNPILEALATVIEAMQTEYDGIYKEIDEIADRLNPEPAEEGAEVVQLTDDEREAAETNLEELNARKETLEKQMGIVMLVMSMAGDIDALTDYVGIVKKVLPAFIPIIEAYLPDITAMMKLPADIGLKVANELKPVSIEIMEYRAEMQKAEYDALIKAEFSPEQAFAIILAKIQPATSPLSSFATIAAAVSKSGGLSNLPSVNLSLGE